MDSEDFKSFCRAFPTSEVGSIPTRSRHVPARRRGGADATIRRRIAVRRSAAVLSRGHAARGLFAAILTAAALALAGSAARAQVPGASPGGPIVTPPRDSVVVTPSVPQAPAPKKEEARPDTTKHRSSPFKVMMRSAVVPGWGQVYNGKLLKAGVVVAGEGFLVYKAFSELQKENDAVDRASNAEPGSPEYDQAIADRNAHMNQKINYIWWTVAVHLLQMADAYVDANLADWSAEVGPDPAGAPGTRVALAYRLRF